MKIKLSRNKFLMFIMLMFTTSFSHAAEEKKGGFSLSSTRVIYKAESKEGNITVVNSAKNAPFLAQSWIENYGNAKDKPPFVITPPLYRQDEGKNTLRIIRNGGNLPDDRESAFWLNVKAIPAEKKDSKGGNSLSFAYVLKVKMFYRPENLSSASADAYKKLSFSRNGATITAHNPTPYYITFNRISLGDGEVKVVTDMVPPMGKQSYNLPANASGQKVSYRTLNDMGGIFPEETKVLVK